MLPHRISISSRLQPLSFEDRVALVIKAWHFFSPIKHAENLAVLGLPPIKGSTQPLSVLQFIQFLGKIGAVDDPFMLVSQIKDLLDAMEREGLITAVGTGSFVMAPQHYYSLKQLTTLEGKGWAWLTPALGPEYLYSYFGMYAVHIIGDKDETEHGGTGWILSERHVLTCAHVINGMTIREEQHFGDVTCKIKMMHPHPTIDVGVIELAEPCLTAPRDIGFRDPNIGEPLYVMGYPPVPMACEAPLILQGGEVVNQGIKGYRGDEVFLYSAIARPGNSGGPIIAKSGQVLGIVTEDRFNRDHPHALFFAGVSTSTIAHALSELDVDVKLPIETYE